ncbi:unnamed protein product [Clavelina lepadiformis]|uniref:BTB domain-containing protein n=1 Tax=Clavelina lepadiformis TaxID=159417 RepID=A0ABP0GZW8_CLALP
MSCIKKFNYPLFESGLVDKSQHASFLFDKMRTFQRDGFLCDVQAPSHEDVVPAHKVVLMSARSSEGDHPMTPASPNDESPRPFYPVDDVFLVDEAYSPISNDGDATEDEKNNSLRRRLSTLNELWESRSCCDVTLVADECRCDAHKVVLAACSSYFSAMFKSEMKEKAMHTITLKGIDSGFFRRMLDFIYKGELLNADVEETMEMLNVAVFYQIVPLINWCNNFLLRNVSSRQVCALYAQSKDLALKEVTESCKSYIHDHFVEMDSVDSDICVLSAEDMASCLKSNRLGGFSNSKTEASILRIVLRWLLHNPQVPPVVQNEIISNVRFALIHPNDILKCSRDVAASAPNYNADMADIPYYNFYSFGPVFRSRVIQALVYHERRFAQPLFQNEVTELRTTEMKLVTVDGVLAQNPVKLPSGSRKVLPARYQKGAVRKIQCRDPYHSVVELNGFIYTIGGTRTYQDGFSRSVVRYDPRLDESIQVACMNEKRGDFVAVTYGDYIFVFGGRNRHGVLTSCERYDPAKNIWVFISDLPQVNGTS